MTQGFLSRACNFELKLQTLYLETIVSQMLNSDSLIIRSLFALFARSPALKVHVFRGCVCVRNDQS